MTQGQEQTKTSRVLRQAGRQSKKVYFIGNPSCGQGYKIKDMFQNLSARLWGWDCEFRTTGSPAETRTLLESLRPDEVEAIFLFGGDGTLNRALPTLLRTGIPLGLLPGGTANDLSSRLGMSLDRDLIQHLLDDRAVGTMDLISVNGKPFATVGGIGFPALTTDEFNQRRGRSWLTRLEYRSLGPLVYRLIAFKKAFLSREIFHQVHLQADGIEEQIRTACVLVANQSLLGHDHNVAPCARIDDGLLDLLILCTPYRTELIKAIEDTKKGQTPPQSLRHTTSRLTIEDVEGRPLLFFGDGEILDCQSRLDIRVMPGALKVYRQDCLGGSP